MCLHETLPARLLVILFPIQCSGAQVNPPRHFNTTQRTPAWNALFSCLSLENCSRPSRLSTCGASSVKPSWLFPRGSCLLSHVQPLSPCTPLVAVCQLLTSVPALGYLWMLRPSCRLRKAPCCGSPSLLPLPLVAGFRPCVQRPWAGNCPCREEPGRLPARCGPLLPPHPHRVVWISGGATGPHVKTPGAESLQARVVTDHRECSDR